MNVVVFYENVTSQYGSSWILAFKTVKLLTKKKKKNSDEILF